MPVSAHHRRRAVIRAARNPGLMMILFILLAWVVAVSAIMAQSLRRVDTFTVFDVDRKPDSSVLAVGSAGAELDPSPTSPPPSPSDSPVVSPAPAIPPPVPPAAPIPTNTARAVAPVPAPAPAPPSGAAAAVAYALRQLGKPYVFGAAGDSSFDCSGLVMRAWEAGGVSLPHSSYSMARSGSRISRDELRPGDLVILYSYGHVQLYIGDGRVVEAPKPGTAVRINALSSRVDALVRVSA